MAVGDAVGAQFYHAYSYDLQPSSGVEWCLTSFMSTATSWYFRDYSSGNIFYAAAGTNVNTNEQPNSMKLFITNTNKLRWYTNGGYYSRYAGVVTKE